MEDIDPDCDMCELEREGIQMMHASILAEIETVCDRHLQMIADANKR